MQSYFVHHFKLPLISVSNEILDSMCRAVNNKLKWHIGEFRIALATVICTIFCNWLNLHMEEEKEALLLNLDWPLSFRSWVGRGALLLAL